MIWPSSIAPFQRAPGRDRRPLERAVRDRRAARGRARPSDGVDVLFDDRDVQPGRQVRRRRADRRAGADHGRQAHGVRGHGRRSGAQGARRRTTEPVAEVVRDASQTAPDLRRRTDGARPPTTKTSVPFGEGVETAMRKTGHLLPRAGRADRPLGRLSEPPRPRQPAGAVERRDRVDREGGRRATRPSSGSTGSGGSPTRCGEAGGWWTSSTGARPLSRSRVARRRITRTGGGRASARSVRAAAGR